LVFKGKETRGGGKKTGKGKNPHPTTVKRREQNRWAKKYGGKAGLQERQARGDKGEKKHGQTKPCLWSKLQVTEVRKRFFGRGWRKKRNLGGGKTLSEQQQIKN